MERNEKEWKELYKKVIFFFFFGGEEWKEMRKNGK